MKFNLLKLKEFIMNSADSWDNSWVAEYYKEKLIEYEEHFGKLPDVLEDSEIYTKFIGRFQSIDYVVHDEIKKLVDPVVLFQLVAASYDYNVDFNELDSGENEVIIKSSLSTRKLSDIRKDELSCFLSELLMEQLVAELNVVSESEEDKENYSEMKERKINHFNHVTLHKLSLRRKANAIMKIVGREVKKAQNNISL
ncbi:MAG: hypothetical protein ACOYEG_09090 [Petrimonas sp.]|jgi:hypothetical protein